MSDELRSVFTDDEWAIVLNTPLSRMDPIWLRERSAEGVLAIANHAIATSSPRSRYLISRSDVKWLQTIIDRTEATWCQCRTCQNIRDKDQAKRLRDKLSAILPPENA